MEGKSVTRLVWLMIEGVPLHVWTKDAFHSIVVQWGEVVEVEDLTSSKEQLFIGRVCVATPCRETISESINLIVEDQSYTVRVIEDSIELLDSGHDTKTMHIVRGTKTA